MDLQHFVCSETSALLQKLIAGQATAPAQQLRAAREALDAAVRALEAPPDADGDIAELAARLFGAADATIRRVREEASLAADAARAEIAARLAEIEDLRRSAERNALDSGLLREDLQAARQRGDSLERELAAVAEARQALETVLQKADAGWRQASEARAALESQLAETRAALEAMRTHAEQLRMQAEREASHAGVVREELQAARQRADSLERELTAVAEARQALETVLQKADAGWRQASEARAALEAQLTETRAALDTMLAEAEQLRAQVGREAAERAALEARLAGPAVADERHLVLAAELETTRTRAQDLERQLADVRHAAQERDAIAAQLEASAARVHALEGAMGDQQGQIRILQNRLEEAALAEARLRHEIAVRPRAADDTGGGPDDADALRTEVERMSSLFDASARAVAEMASVGTATELLAEFVKRLSLHFSRVALFRQKGNRLEGEQQIGFDGTSDFSKLVVPVGVDSMLTRAATSGVYQSLYGENVAERSGTPFGGTPTSAVALPIALHGTTLAVVYADDSDMPEAARGPAVHESSLGYARLLAGQVTALLVRHTHELKTLAELSQYAATLLQEAREMYLADVEAGKNAALVRSRLKENIECASQLYAYRAAMEGTAAAALLDQQIAIELEHATPFARDLAAIVREMSASKVELTAEAS